MRTLILLATLGAVAGSLAAQEPPDSAQVAQAALLAELATPGPEHRRLAGLEGAWDVEVRIPSAGTSAPGRATNRMILGGRFLTTRVTATIGGVATESLTIIGFDRGPGVYTAVGFDTFGTFYVTAAGPWDAERNRVVMRGAYDDPVTGHQHDYEFLLTFDSPDHFTWTVVFLEGGQRMPVAEVDYRR